MWAVMRDGYLFANKTQKHQCCISMERVNHLYGEEAQAVTTQ